jgi:hypothetical protein
MGSGLELTTVNVKRRAARIIGAAFSALASAAVQISEPPAARHKRRARRVRLSRRHAKALDAYVFVRGRA